LNVLVVATQPIKPEGEQVSLGNENRSSFHVRTAEPMVDIKRIVKHTNTSQGIINSTPGKNKRSWTKGFQVQKKGKSIAIATGKATEELKFDDLVRTNGPLMPMAVQHSQQTVDWTSKVKSSGRRNSKAEQTIMTLLKHLATAYQYMNNYKCTEAIKLFKQLSKSQYNTGWTLTQVAKALFESIRYSEAEKVYKEAFAIEPYRLEGIEYYSTCLWHLRKQVDLCALANRALTISVFAPETWCAVGNTFSLQKEHETALKFFGRAIQLNPRFAYAHTLSGHEYVANEDFESARKCYQDAMSCDERHYNAFWGMGNIYLRQEKYEQAIQYFKSAININSRSSVLYTYLGMTHFHNQQPKEALDSFAIAEKMDPNNPLNKYQKATVLISLDKLQEALTVLEDLHVRVPKEAPIHVLMGKIYKRLGNKEKALTHFNKAIDLNPKEINLVKSLIDRLERDVDMLDDNDL
jgi:anaphase-promoting complex subunit 3